MTARKPIIAIDGPVGAGKSTTARKVAKELGFRTEDVRVITPFVGGGFGGKPVTSRLSKQRISPD